MTEKSHIGKCRLCNESKPLCNSHIVPEFCYTQAYDGKHRTLDMNLNGKAGPPFRPIQKGHREHLLCRTCEGIISQYEHRFREFWFGPNGLPARLDFRGPVVVLSGADYASFKLFHLSVLWRAGVSALCRKVSLGRYEGSLREMILSGSPGEPTRFPICGQILLDDNGAVVYGVVTSPSRYRSPPSYAYSTIYAGCEWHVVVTDHPTNEQEILSGAISPQGEVVLACTHWLRTGSINAIADGFRRRKQACSR